MRSYQIKQLDDGMVNITANCVVTSQPYSVVVNYKDFVRFQAGALAQDALSSLSPEDREFLLSGISPVGWEQSFGHITDDYEPQ